MAVIVALTMLSQPLRAAPTPDTHSAAHPLAYRFREAGSGGPVVVFEYGLGDRLDTWKSVQDEVSQFTETFSYNRAGYAGSPPALGTRDAATVVTELRALLAEHRLSPPYVLVGHSLGGLYMLYYARNFPGEVAGLVLVDSSHWEQTDRMRRLAPALAAEVTKERLRMPGVLGLEATSLDLSGREVRDSPPLRPMPLIVLTAGLQPDTTSPLATGSRVRVRRGMPAKFWFELQSEIAAQVPDARHTIVRGSGHFIHHQQPRLVAAAVRDVVVALRGQ